MLACGLLAAALLGGCAQQPLAPLAEGKRWSGRLSLHVASEPPQGFSGQFELVGSPARGELRLTGPLGQQLAEMRWAPDRAQLLAGPGGPREAGSLEALMRELGGTPLPVVSLFGWLHGRADAADGWQVDLSRRASGRIEARRDAPKPTVRPWLLLDSPDNPQP